MIKNIPIDMIFTVFWKIKDEADDDSYTYMSVIYTVTFISEIRIELERIEKANAGALDFDLEKSNNVNINKGQDLILSAENSAFVG